MSEKILLAPFQGITAKAYRNALASHIGGYDAFYAPFVSGPGKERINPSKLKDLLPREGSQMCTVPQIISSDAGEVLLFAKTLSAHGFHHINWNLGCPFPRIANKKRGCGLLTYPEEIDKILNFIFAHISSALSIKLRLGYHSPGEIVPLIDIFNQYPIHHLIIHPRTGTQRYQGEVDLEMFRYCLRQSRIKVIYNGDIYNKSRYLMLKSMFPQADTWMLGRGALIDPFLALHIKGIEPGDKLRRVKLTAFLQDLVEHSGSHTRAKEKTLGFMKAVWYYLAGSFQFESRWLGDIQNAKDIDTYQRAAHIMLQQKFSTDKEKEHYFRHVLKHV